MNFAAIIECQKCAVNDDIGFGRPEGKKGLGT